MTKKSLTATLCATSVEISPLTPDQIQKLQDDQNQLQAIIRILNLFNIGQGNQSPSTRVKLLIQRDEQRKDTILKLITRRRAQPTP